MMAEEHVQAAQSHLHAAREHLAAEHQADNIGCIPRPLRFVENALLALSQAYPQQERKINAAL